MPSRPRARLLFIALVLGLAAQSLGEEPPLKLLIEGGPQSVRLRDPSAAPGSPPAEAESQPSKPPGPVRIESVDAHRNEERSAVQAVVFRGIHIGKTSTAELQQAWGTPVKVVHRGSTELQTFLIDKYDRVDVTLYQDRVISISIKLSHRLSPATLEAELGLDKFESIDVLNAQGEPIGRAYPERCVALTFADRQRDAISHVVFDAPDPQPFLLRARARSRKNYTGCLADAGTALELDPQLAEAHVLRSRVLLATGQTRDALASAEAALTLNRDDPAGLLAQARAWGEMGEHEKALDALEKAIGSSGERGELKAEAVCRFGNVVADGPRRDYKLALDYHLQAIRLAEPLANSTRADISRAAWDVLLEAHLAAARDIAWGDWKGKQEVAEKWLTKAAALLDQRGTDPTQRLDDSIELCRAALDAYVGLGGQLDPTPWIEQLDRSMSNRLAANRDPLFEGHLRWDWGVALYDVLQIDQLRGDPAAAIRFGQQAAEQLEAGAQRRDAPLDTYLVGRLCFRIGAIQAISRKNHVEAVRWYEQALPTLGKLAPTSAFADPGQQGETLVSMAVSFWAVGQQEKALQLTQQGLEWMRKAVEAGILSDKALGVPYANLARMYNYRGEKSRAAEYLELAERLDHDLRR